MIWKKMRTKDTWHPHTFWRGRIYGFVIDITGLKKNDGSVVFRFTAERKSDGQCFGTGWTNINRSWPTLERTQEVAEEWCKAAKDMDLKVVFPTLPES